MVDQRAARLAVNDESGGRDRVGLPRGPSWSATREAVGRRSWCWRSPPAPPWWRPRRSPRWLLGRAEPPTRPSASPRSRSTMRPSWRSRSSRRRVIGVLFGILITRPAGRPLRPLADALVAASQAVPPVVVVALAFPVLGFGAAPTVLALAIYCLMPVLRGTAAALDTTRAATPSAAARHGPHARPDPARGGDPARLAGGRRIAAGRARPGDRHRGGRRARRRRDPRHARSSSACRTRTRPTSCKGAAATAALAFLADGLFLLALAGARRRARLPGRATPLAESPHRPG